MAVLRRLLTFSIVILSAGLIVYALSFVFVLRTGALDERHPADAIVVLGAAQYDGRPSPVLEARLDHALILYEAGLAPVVVLTGGIGAGDTTSEAMVSKRYLEARNIPAEALVVRPEGRSTVTSMEAVARWLEDHDLESVILVSDPFHMSRLRLEARRHEMTAYVSPTRSSPISGSIRRELGFVAEEALKVPVAWARSW